MTFIAFLAGVYLVLALVQAQAGQTGWAIFDLCYFAGLMTVLVVKHYG